MAAMSVSDRLPGAQRGVLLPVRNGCRRGAPSTVLQPPPAAPSDWVAKLAYRSFGPLLFQTVSAARVPSGLRYSEVPPTPTTVFSAAGTSAWFSEATLSLSRSQEYQPSSPVEAVMTMPAWLYAAFVVALWLGSVSMPPYELLISV